MSCVFCVFILEVLKNVEEKYNIMVSECSEIMEGIEINVFV